MTHGIDILCLSEGLINCLDMLSAHDLKTCKEVSRVFRQAVEETNQRRLAECRDNSLLCSELQTRMREHCFQEFHINISPTALYWHTFHWMQTFVKRDNVLFNNKAHDLAIENASNHPSLMALCSIASVQQIEIERFLVESLKQLVKQCVTSIHEQVNQQTTSLDIIRLLMQCANTNTNSLQIVRRVLMIVLLTRNRPCLIEMLKFNEFKQLLINENSLFEIACTVGCREVIDLSLESSEMNIDCAFALRFLGGTKRSHFEKEMRSLNYEEFQKENISRLGGHLDSLRAFINSHYFQKALLPDIATSFGQALVLTHSTCASMIFGTNRFLSVPKDLYIGSLNCVRVANLFTALRVTEQINRLSSDHLQLLHELATQFNISAVGIAAAAPSQRRSICTPNVIAAASICAILSIGVALLNSLQ